VSAGVGAAALGALRGPARARLSDGITRSRFALVSAIRGRRDSSRTTSCLHTGPCTGNGRQRQRRLSLWRVACVSRSWCLASWCLLDFRSLGCFWRPWWSISCSGSSGCEAGRYTSAYNTLFLEIGTSYQEVLDLAANLLYMHRLQHPRRHCRPSQREACSVARRNNPQSRRGRPSHACAQCRKHESQSRCATARIVLSTWQISPRHLPLDPCTCATTRDACTVPCHETAPRI